MSYFRKTDVYSTLNDNVKMWWVHPWAGRDFTFNRPFRADGTLTKSGMMLSLVDQYPGKFTRKQLLRMIGVKNWDAPGMFTNMWSSAINCGLIGNDNGKVIPGSRLKYWVKEYISQ